MCVCVGGFLFWIGYFLFWTSLQRNVHHRSQIHFGRERVNVYISLLNRYSFARLGKLENEWAGGVNNVGYRVFELTLPEIHRPKTLIDRVLENSTGLVYIHGSGTWTARGLVRGGVCTQALTG